jgi:uncharacterized protein YbjT (DUF2867 family)
MRVLVVGANGQLGSSCCERLVGQGHDVVGTVRRQDRAAGLPELGVTVRIVDLASQRGLRPVLRDVDAVVLTANAAVPRAQDDVTAFERGTFRLVDSAAEQGVGRFVLVTVPPSPLSARVPLLASRRRLEQRLGESGMDTVVLRFAPFMESWLALVGSSLPLRGEPRATVGRPSPLLHLYRRVTGTSIEDRGVMLVPTSPAKRHAFISVRDAAAVCADAVRRPDLAGQVLDVAGPEALTWREVAAAYGDVLGRRVRMVSIPVTAYAAMASMLAPIAPAASTTLAELRIPDAAGNQPGPDGGWSGADRMTTVLDFLREKAALPALLPTVA